MSKAALALLTADGDGKAAAPPESAAKRARALLEGRATPTEAPKPRQTVDLGDTSMDEGIGAGEAILHGVTKGAGMAVGGVHAIGDLLTGRGTDQAVKDIGWWQQALTYDPRTPAGQGAADVGAHVMSTVGAPVAKLKEFAGDSAEAAGWGPLASTAMNVAPDAILSLLGAPGAPAGAGAALVGDARALAGGVADATAPARAAVSKAVARTDLPAAGAELNPLAQQSMGAAAATPRRLADATPELQAAIRQAAQKTGGAVAPEVLERHLAADTLPIPMRLTEGQATQDVGLLSNERNMRAKHPEYAERFAEQNRQLVDNMDEIRREAAPGVVGNDHVQNGQQFVDKYKTMDEAAREEITAAYTALREANGGDFPVDGPAFVAAADTALKRSMKSRYLPSQIAADLESIRNGDVAMNFEMFENLRTNLAAEARKADRSGDGNAMAAVNLTREALESLPLTGAAEALKPLADHARSLAKSRFDRIKVDPAYKAAIDDATPTGEASPLADGFVEKYLVKGTRANVQRMRQTFDGDAEMGELMAAAGLNYLKSKSGVDMFTGAGNFSQAGYNRALAQLSPKLDDLVGETAAEQARTLGGVAHDVMFQPSGHHVNNSNTGVMAAAREGAKTVTEMAVNAAVPSAELGTRGRALIAKRAEKRQVRESLKTGAGLTRLRDLTSLDKRE